PLPEFRPPALLPVPTVMLAVLAAPDVSAMLVALRLDEPSVQPPIDPLVEVIDPENDPLVAVTLPVIVAFVATSAPPAVTRHAALARLAWVAPAPKAISVLPFAELRPAMLLPAP